MSVPAESFYAKLPGNAKPKTPLRSGTLPIPQTPISLKTSGSSPYDSGAHLRPSLNKRLAMETKGHFLGSMPPLKFIQMFFPDSSATVSLGRTPFAEIVSDSVKIETDMYEPFITAAALAAPSLKFLDTHSTGDVNCDNLATDVSAYKVKDLPPKPDQTDFSRMELFAEFKFNFTADPFIDPEEPLVPDNDFERDSDAARLLRGQIASYVAALSGSQFRVHVFSILICGKFARLMYWDRNGAIVTRAFDYTILDFLSLFLRHYDLAVNLRGHDSTITIPSGNLVEKVPNFDRNELADYNNRHREFWLMLIPDRDDASQESKFLISYPPKYTSRSPFGRATRPMIAYDLQQSCFVFVKDYWRPIGSDKEGEIYRILAEKKVPHIAPFGNGNDVRGTVTVTDQLRKEKWACSTSEMVALCLYRMSLDTIGRRLTEFKSSQEFVESVADAMEAHDCAFFDANILHRDISVGNIITTPKGEGLLIDWDLCINLGNQGVAHRPERTGTWQFMSAALLSEPHLNQAIEDDRESAFYVLLYIGLLYTKHNQVSQKLGSYMEIFDYTTIVNNVAEGGRLKTNFLVTDKEAKALTFQCPPMNNLIKELRATFAIRYVEPPSEEAFARYESMKRNPNVFADVLVDHPAALYEVHKRKLQERGWLVETLERYLSDPEWPQLADAAELNPIVKDKRRKREERESQKMKNSSNSKRPK